MVIVQEFENGCILYGVYEVQPEQSSDSEESDNHTTDAEASYDSVTLNDTQNNCQAEVEPQLPKEEEIPEVQEEQTIEEEIPEVQEEQTVEEEIPELVQEEQTKEEKLQKEVDLEKEEQLQKPEEEHHHQLQSVVELLNSRDPQPLEEAKAKGNPSRETQNSDADGNQSDHELVAVSPPPVPQQLPWDVLPPGSKAKGVCYHKNNQQWEAHLWIQGRQLRNRKKRGVQIFMGNYSTEDEAKQAHDRAAIKFELRTSGRIPKPYALNFHESAQADFIAEHKDWSLRDFLWKLRRYSLKFSSGESTMKGVTVRKRFQKRRTRGEEAEPAVVSGEMSMSMSLRYEAKIAKTDGRKMTISVGTYGSEEEAGKAYDRALLFNNKDKEEVEQWHVITNFRPSNYTVEEVLEAGEKLVFR